MYSIIHVEYISMKINIDLPLALLHQEVFLYDIDYPNINQQKGRKEREILQEIVFG